MGAVTGILVAAAAAAGLVVITALYIRGRIRRISQAAFGTPDLVEGIRRETQELEQTPKSLSSMESMVSERIAGDFPELNMAEMKNRVSRDLTAYLSGGETPCRNIEVHQSVVNRYLKTPQSATLRFQAAAGFQRQRNDRTAETMQDRFELDYVYALDETAAGGAAACLRCPNCGAPVLKTGDKTCPYCGAGIVTDIVMIWRLDAIRRA